jgi:hypothetical protein
VTQNDDFVHEIVETRSASAAQEPTAQRRVIQLPQSATLRENESSSRKRTAYPCARFGNGSGYQRKDNVVTRISDCENVPVVGRHGASLREHALETTGVVRDGKLIPHSQRGTDVN